MKDNESIKKTLTMGSAAAGLASVLGGVAAPGALADGAASLQKPGPNWQILHPTLTPEHISIDRAREILEKEYDLTVKAPLFYRIHQEHQVVEVTDWESVSVRLPVESMCCQPRNVDITSVQEK